MKRFAVFAILTILTIPAIPALATPHGDCYHACDEACHDRIEAYETSIGACANGAPGTGVLGATGPLPGLCSLFSGIPRQPVLQEMFCEEGVGCSITGRLKCGSGIHQRPAMPNIPLDGPGGVNCGPRWHNSGFFLPAVVIHEDNGACRYMDGTFITWQCDSAGTGTDVIIGTHGSASGGPLAEAGTILP